MTAYTSCIPAPLGWSRRGAANESFAAPKRLVRRTSSRFPEERRDEVAARREKVFGYGILILGGAVVIGLTLLATAFVVLFASDTYAGVVAASDGGIHGTYRVTELVTGLKSTMGIGTFTSDDGSIVLVGTTLAGDDSDVGTELPCQYVPSLRDGHLPVVVTRGWAADVISPMIGLVISLVVAGVGWWFLGTVIIGSIRDAIHSRAG